MFESVVSSFFRSSWLVVSASFLSRDSSLFESVVSSFFRSSWLVVSASFFCSSLLGLIATSTVRPSEVTTSPLELIRIWISDPLARISVPESPASFTRISITSLSVISAGTVLSSLSFESVETANL